ncbi:hypothetical protein R3751_07170 [Halorubrum distributum]|uniref:hypothetical protein n=1 Tax=Halorubrum distributum TaxID=29283 RepID=UPI0029532F6A|nr:hypothetical protein [Halorubrum distributum]MDV7349558.1 hypothetical protein [Halorubrum distributum]
MAVATILRDVDDPERIKEVSGRKRTYFVEEGQQSELVKPRQIPDTDLYLETNFSANTVVRTIERVINKYGYDGTELEIFTGDS